MPKLTALIVPLLWFSLAWGEIYYVVPGQSIQDMVNCALDGDTILIEDGVFSETTVLYGKTLCIGSRYLLDQDTSHVSATIVSPDFMSPDTGSCFVYAYGELEGGRLVGLTMTHGRGTIWNRDPGYYYGGAIFISGAFASIERCRLAHCSTDYGGGIAALDRDIADSATVCHVRDCIIEDCKSGGGGGGINTHQARLEVHNSDFISDSSAAGLGAGAIWALPISTVIDSSRFFGCVGGGGALLVSLGSNVLTNCVFGNNGSVDAGLVTDFYVVGCNASIRGCLFEGNSTDHFGMFLCEYAPEYRIDFVGNVIRNHNLTTARELFVVCSYFFGEFAYNIFIDNASADATALGTVQRIRRLHHNMFLNNRNDSGEVGSAIYVQRSNYDDDFVVLDSNVFAGNSSPAITSHFHPAYGYWPVHAENNWWGDPSGPYHPELNPGGQGDTILQDSIYFIPWLTEAPDTSMPPGYVTVREPSEIPSTWHLLECYPNPFNSSIRIVLAGFAGNDFEITLHNLLGQVVDVVHRGPLTGGQITYQSPPELASGVYFLRASDHTGIQSRKIILMK